MVTDWSSARIGTLASTAPGRREYGIAIAAVTISVLTLGALAPFARVPLARVDAFIPLYESALAITDLITVVLLANQFRRERSLALLILTSGYLFSTLIIVPHALTFPGDFAPQGLFGTAQTTSWIYCFWHGGFALYVLGYALAEGYGIGQLRFRSFGMPFLMACGCTGALVFGLTVLAVSGQRFLTPIMNGTDYSMLVSKGISPAICLFIVIALALLGRLQRASALNLWLFVVMAAWLCDVVLSAVLGSSRFDLGWYGGRSFGLVSASFLLVTMLIELSEVHEMAARAELHRAESLFEAVINMTPDLVYVKELESRALLRNPAARFGKTWDEIKDRRESDWHHDPEEAKQVVANDRKVIETGKSMQFEEKFTTPYGVRMLLSTKSPLFDQDGKILGTIGVSTDITERENRAKQIEFITRELTHRTKNLLMVIQAVARQSIRQSPSLEDFERQFNERLASLARLHDLLIQEEWRGTSLRAIAQTQAGPFAGTRAEIDGPDVFLRPDIAQVISMVFHELATNASKYGALSGTAGIVVVKWGYVGDAHNRLFIRWEEIGGPPVLSPQRKGFGTVVLERMALQIADASTSLRFSTPGVVWYLEAPLQSFSD
jgi:PAS domain S-box-containing protein